MRTQNVLMCKSNRRGGFVYKGKTLNPHEKPVQSAAWAIERFTRTGNFAVIKLSTFNISRFSSALIMFRVGHHAVCRDAVRQGLSLCRH